MDRILRLKDKVIESRAESVLILGIFLIDAAAAIPFGISNSDPNVALTPFEWFFSGVLAILAITVLAGMFNKRVLAWAGLMGGFIWIAVPAGTFYDNLDSDPGVTTKLALILLPLGFSLAHFALFRYVIRPGNATKIHLD